ncbi:hypothetical protein MTO96_048491 [Rhipicephalus appendiculatus]
MATNIAIEPPGKMCLTGDLCANWKSFRQRFDLYLTAAGKKNKSDEQKVAMLLMIARPAVIDVYNTLDFGEAAPGADRSQVLSVVLEKLDNYFAPRRNEVYSRYLLRCRKQEKDEPFDSFLTDLRTRAKDCNFEGQRDQVIFGIHNEDVRIKLLVLEDSTLEKVAKVCAVHESSAKQLKAFRQETSNLSQDADPLHAVKGTKQKSVTKTPIARTKACWYCGTVHIFKKSLCPAWGKECTNCGRRNHFAKQCKTRGGVRALYESDSSSEDILVVQEKKKN